MKAAVTPETHKLQNGLMRMLRTSRLYLDGHRASLRKAPDKATLERRKDLARDFVRYIRNAGIPDLLSLIETPRVGRIDPCPVRFMADLQELYAECHPQSELLPLASSRDEMPEWVAVILKQNEAQAVGTVSVLAELREIKDALKGTHSDRNKSTETLPTVRTLLPHVQSVAARGRRLRALRGNRRVPLGH